MRSGRASRLVRKEVQGRRERGSSSPTSKRDEGSVFQNNAQEFRMESLLILLESHSVTIMTCIKF